MSTISDTEVTRSYGQSLAEALEKMSELGPIRRIELTDVLKLINELGQSVTIYSAGVGMSDAGRLATDILSRTRLVSFKEVDSLIAVSDSITIKRRKDGKITMFVVRSVK